MTEPTLKHLHEDLLSLRQEMSEIKKKLFESDIFLSSDDKNALAIAREEYKKGKTKSIEQLEKELK